MLRAKVEQKLGEMIRRNPTRADLLEKFHSMIAEYNAGSASVDQLFEHGDGVGRAQLAHQ
jgi:hypothetical protein